MRNASKLLFAFLVIPLSILAQDEEEKKWELKGYLKDMVSFTAIPELDSSLVDNLVHNRLNFHWYPTEKFSAKVEIRNRIFHGDLVSAIPEYGELIDVNNDFFDLSYTWDNGDVVFHTMLDRAYVQWNEENWQMSVGRQRINWGVNLAWNPNDIFNAYSLFDFDYEERPGSDAFRFQRFIGYAGGVEFAAKLTDDWKDFTAAGMYKWNMGLYDVQALGGVMKNNVVLGGAWAGNIGQVGFKGEFSYFSALDKDDKDSFLGSVSMDYSFPSSLYFNGSFLYNSYAPNIASGNSLRSSANVDVRYISPYTWSTFLQSMYTFHPLFSGGLMVLYYPGESGIFFNPVVTFSPLTNLDLDVIGQVFLDDEASNLYLLYARLKFSF